MLLCCAEFGNALPLGFERASGNNLFFKLKGAEKARIKKSREGSRDPSFHRTEAKECILMSGSVGGQLI